MEEKNVKATEIKEEGSTEDLDMIDLNEPEEKETKADKLEESNNKMGKRGLGGKNAPKSTDDFIAKQKKRKRTRKIITLVIVVLIVVGMGLYFKSCIDKTKNAFKDLTVNNVQTSFVEKKKLYESKDATGTLYALESRTITRSLQGSGQGGADIVAVNVEVGDHVNVGDILVEFSSENIEKSIEETKEDIGTQKKLDAISVEDAQRDYVYSYSSAATSMQNSAKSVDRALEALYEACDAYGDAKRARDEIRDLSDEELVKKYSNSSASMSETASSEDGEGQNIKVDYSAQAKPLRESLLKSAEDAVYRAQQAEEQAQRAYDDAVEAQATGGQGGIAGVSNSLSNADSTYKKAQINSGEQVKKLTRQLNNSIDSLDDYVVPATISGVITEVNVSEGNTFSSGSVLTIQDDSGFKADVLVDEYDIPKVKKAYNEKKAAGKELEVVVKTDATGDEEYKGHVTRIAPTSTTTTTGGATSGSNGASSSMTSSSSSTANYKVSIELDEIDEAFMIGMSAKVAIVVDESPENSLCVAYNCVEERDGKYYVRVMDENGDKNTADDNMPKGMSGGKDKFGKQNDDGTGIVVEVDDDEDKGGDKDKKKNDGFLAKLQENKNKEPEEVGRRYREEEVEKLFETDFYVAVVPKRDGGIKEGDEVMVVTEKSSGNDLMMMFGGPGGF